MQIINNQNCVLRSVIAGLLFLITAKTLPAQEQGQDSTSMTKELNEIVISAPTNVVLGNKSIFFPPKELKNATNSCVQLLSGMQIPELIVNPASGTVSLSGDNVLSIRINGREASESELASISSKDISKIEYISNPGVRYGDVDAVLNIIVKRRDEGYGVMLNLLQSPNRGWGNYTAAIKYNIGKSEWTLDYTSNPMWNMDCYRDNSEYINLPDGTYISRVEEGKKVPNRMVTHHASLQYSYAESNRLLFNVQARLLRKNDKIISEGDITTIIGDYCATGFEHESSRIKSWQGDLDIYFYYKINNRNKLYFNVVPTIIDGISNRSYQTSESMIASDIDNRGFHLLAEGIWEGRIRNGSLSAGFRYKNSWDKAIYPLTGNTIREEAVNNYLFAEWTQSLDDLQYSVGMGGTLYTISSPISYTSTFINPRLSARYSPFDRSGFSLSLATLTVTPSINQLNPILQQVDMYQWAEGNIELRPYQRYEQQLGFDGTFNDIFVKGNITNRYCHNPIMDIKEFNEGAIINSFKNAGYNNDFEVSAMLRLPLFIKQLTLSVDGGWHYTISKGYNYRHTYSQPFINAQLMYLNGPWWVMLKYNSTYNNLWGEMISSTNQNLLNIGLGYTYRKATFMAGIVNPFGNVELRTENLNAIAGYDRTYQASGSNQLVWVGVTFNFHQGKKRAKMQKKLDNTIIYESINNTMK